MSKKYYNVEFNIIMGAWGENEDEAYATARRRVEAADNIIDLIWDYDDCVHESDGDWDWDDPDAPKLEEANNELGEN